MSPFFFFSFSRHYVESEFQGFYFQPEIDLWWLNLFSGSLVSTKYLQNITCSSSPLYVFADVRCRWENTFFFLNNTICTVSNCVKKATIDQGCDYLVCMIGNMDVKPHHLVQIWARASASTHLERNVQMPIAWGTPSWDGLMTGSDWLESLMGSCLGQCLPSAILPDMKSLYGYSNMVEIMPRTRSSLHWLWRSGSVKEDGAVISSLMMTDWNPNMSRVRMLHALVKLPL